MTGSSQKQIPTNYHLDGVLHDGQHDHRLRVQYEDKDAGGIVCNVQYLAFAERAHPALLCCLSNDQPGLLSQEKQAFVVRRIDIDFRHAAAFDGVLGMTSEVPRVGGVTVTLRQTITNVQLCLIVARLVVEIGIVDLQRMGAARACCMPPDIRKKLAS